jgi:hypothetical protein
MQRKKEQHEPHIVALGDELATVNKFGVDGVAVKLLNLTIYGKDFSTPRRCAEVRCRCIDNRFGNFNFQHNVQLVCDYIFVNTNL